MQLNTNHGPVEFVLWDTVGQEKTGSLKQAFYLDASCAIIMFDLSARETLRSVRLWEKDLRKVCGDIPVVLVGNKCDSEDLKVKSNQIENYMSSDMDYVSISCLTCQDFEKPFVMLLRKLLKDPKVELDLNLMVNQIGEDLDSEILGHEFKSDGKNGEERDEDQF
jgi:GTP-binding nuclear protein Ran